MWDGDLGKDWVFTAERSSVGSRSAYCDSTAPSRGPYSTDVQSWLYAGPFDLSDATTALLTFDVFLDNESGDSLSVTFSTDEIDFTGFAYGTNTGNVFVSDEVDLGSVPVTGDDLVGEPTVWVAFIFTSDSTENSLEGTYLDNVRLVKDPEVPTISDISPGTGSAGTETEVTITGTGFGDSQGTGRVDFTYDQLASTTIEGPVTSWSDTQITCIVPIEMIDDYPAAAGSGPVTVTNHEGKTSVGHDFDVTFAYGGIKWAEPAMDFVVNQNTTDTPDARSLVDAAASTWSTASAFEMSDVGTTLTDAYTSNGTNEVFWSDTELGPGVLAAAGIWYTGSTIEEVDLGFNDSKRWGDGTGGTYDVQSIALHELGHALNLRDLYGNDDAPKTMYGYGGGGGQKRNLHASDIAGAQWIYPPLDLEVSAGPSLALPDESIDYQYDVTNLTSADVTSVVIRDSVNGLVSTIPTLGPSESVTVTLTTSFPEAATYSHEATATTVSRGTTFTATADTVVQVALPAIDVDPVVTPNPSLIGSSVTVRYTVSNTGPFPLTSVTVTDTVLGVSFSVPGTLAPGATTTPEHVFTAQSAARITPTARGSYSWAVAEATATPQPVSVYERLAGASRIETAIKASQRAFPTPGSAGTVVIASAFGWADALPGSALGGAVDGPLLLVNQNDVPSNVRAEIRRLGATKAYILGGTAVLTDDVIFDLTIDLGLTAKRLGGTNRYDTARKIASEVLSLEGSVDTAFVATGDTFADALSASSIAAAMKAPILLTQKTSLPSETKSALSAVGPDTIVVCGGTGVVSNSVETALGSYASSVIRKSGTSRYDTSKSVVEWGESQLAPSGPTGLFLATGTNYPDALSGGVLAGTADAQWRPLMLTDPTSLSPQVSSYMQANSASLGHVGVLGGTAAVSNTVLNSAKGLLPR